ncbi:MAG: relaxase/mobilization nuclease domain-containing protein [Proteobacteria bacterium]|nr:relaxase/mobilization nuclease domain-containing protein [Pseudomonadota bacterium]
MIAKHVPMRTLARSNFAELVEYITDAQDKTERLGEIRVTNCAAATLPAVLGEVLATQRQNTRAAGDKTFHLLVSFRPGEAPDAATLQAIEARLAAGLGFGGHQRVSAVHHDTDNVHLHIAINKIHPERRTLHEPFQSYRTLADLCVTLEREYGLQADNHVPLRSVAEGRAADMERHAGVESLVGWVRRVCLEDLLGARSWAELHQVLSDNGLVLRPRGNGLIVESQDGTRVKASTLARGLSKPALEARLGPFGALAEGPAKGASDEPPAPAVVRDDRHYRKSPVRLRIDTTALHARYQAEQQRSSAQRSEALAGARRRRLRAVDDAWRANRLWRATIRVADGKGIDKRLLYAQASRALRERLAQIHTAYARERAALYDSFRRRTWADWLKHEALQGNAAALAALRAREAAQGLTGNTLAGAGTGAGANVDPLRPGPAPVQDTVTKKGTIIFRAGASAVRDDGDRLQVSRALTREGVKVALGLAMARYGREITVCGTPEFKALVIRAAVDARFPLTFADPALEGRRQRLFTQETAHESTEHPERGRADRGRPGGAGARAHRYGKRSGDRPDQDRTRAAGDASPRAAGKPHPGRAGGVPPPASRHRLRDLSELGVVRFARGGEVLLPRDVPRHLEQLGAAPDHPLRRGAAGAGGRRAGGMTPAQRAAAVRYIAEREEKRQKGIDIPKYALYDGRAGVILFAGLRTVDGQPLALLRPGDAAAGAEGGAHVVLVLPVDAATARRLSRVSRGDAVSVTRHGTIQRSGGHSR